jgi:glutaconate CoA-transferase subunit B
MVLLEVLPGKTAKDIQELVSFELLVSKDLKEMAEPTAEDLRLLREVCDPEGYFLNRKVK